MRAEFVAPVAALVSRTGLVDTSGGRAALAGVEYFTPVEGLASAVDNPAVASEPDRCQKRGCAVRPFPAKDSPHIATCSQFAATMYQYLGETRGDIVKFTTMPNAFRNGRNGKIQ